MGVYFWKIQGSYNFFEKLSDLMKDDGISLTHTIGSANPPSHPNAFVNKYIFPGGKIPSLSELIPHIEECRLVLTDCESLIRHYDKTLKAWLDRFMLNQEKAKNLFDKQFVRDWLVNIGWDKNPPAPNLPPEIVDSTRHRYLQAHYLLTGKELL